MATTSGWIKNLRLRNKLALIYTIAFTLILGAAFVFIYSTSEKNRKEEFFKRLSDRAISTFKISVQVEQIDNKLLRLFDKNTINSLSDEKILLFDSSGELLYSNTDVDDIKYADSVLTRLKGAEDIFQTSDDTYELLGLQFTDKDKTYYCVARAFDRFGKSKMHFLAILLSVTFVAVTLLMAILSFSLSALVTRPITKLTREIEKVTVDNLSTRVKDIFANDEIGFLAHKFNELIDKVESAFKFQYHFIHHLSHELKTPLAIMMASAERALVEEDPEKLKSSMQFQKNSIMELSNVIIAMLEISKTENKMSTILSESIRIDEILFECMDEIIFLNVGLQFDFKIDTTLDEASLTVMGSSRMIKMAVMNLVKNAVNFSYMEKPAIEILSADKEVIIKLSNDGGIVEGEEQSKLFKHMFRGKNSASVKGFGLGLVLTHRIVVLHKGSLEYSVRYGRNYFTLKLPTIS